MLKLFPFLRTSDSRFPKLVSGKVTRSNWMLIAVCLFVGTYLLLREPLLLALFGCASAVFLGLWHVFRAIPIVERLIGKKIKFWHITTAIITATMLFAVFEMPAQAIFLSGLEAFFVDLASQAQGAGSGETVSADVIALIFNLIRGVFLLLVAAAALFAYNQSQQGNDWRPIVTQVGLAFAIVLAIDIITFLFIGDGAGGGAGGAGGAGGG